MKQKFPISFRSENGAFDNSRGIPEFLYTGTNAITGGTMKFRIAHDSALADVASADFELRLHQDHHFTTFGEHARHRRNQERSGDKTRVADRKIERLREIGTFQ